MKFIKNLGAKLLRFVGILAVIYVSMVFYLALTERRNAYPRAIPHKEARAAIDVKAQSISCTLEDGTVLEGWKLGEAGTPTLLYYPDADEDAAQFLAELDRIEGITLTAFNYRGSGNNKGTPSEDNWSPDSREILECATQINGKHPEYVVGRGTGAILAFNNSDKQTKIVLIDPVESIAEVLVYKYRFLYPEFLVRAKDSINTGKNSPSIYQVGIMLDRAQFVDRSQKSIQKLKGETVWKRDGASFRDGFIKILHSYTPD
jgi:hypothetical protein